jgi:hypothetical protein
MKKITYLLITLIVLSCSSDDSENDNPQNPITITSLEISSSTDTITADGNDSVTFSVIARDENQNTVQNSNYTIYINGSAHNSNSFSSNTAGEYNVYAKINSIQSNMITITAEEVHVNLSSINLSTNTSLIIADGNFNADLSAIFYDDNNNQINNVNYEIIDNGTVLSSSNLSYSTTVSGIHNLKIQAEGIESNTININARVNVNYNQITIPVIFHIVHFGESTGSGTNLTQSQVTSLLNKLNNGFSNQYNSNNPNTVDTKVSFRLATLDSNNNQLSESGINRINATSYDVGSSNGADIANDQKLGPNESWNLGGDSFWNPRNYLNLWIYPDQSGSSSTTLPRVYESSPLNGLDTVPDSCQCDAYNQFFQSCKIDTNAALNRTTIIHEVGHAFGLKHNFSTDNCNSSDYCPDTYSYVLGNTNQACNDNLGTNVTDNFMDYTGSYTTFTYDQRERIHHVFKYGLWFNELKNSNK